MAFKQKILLKLGRDMHVGPNNPASSYWKWKQPVSLCLCLSFLGLYWHAQASRELKIFWIGLCLQF